MSSLRHNDPDRTEVADAYLDAARACILDVGWRRTTLTEVARRAGVSRMTIYRSWADMPTLLGDLMTREWGGVVATAVAAETADETADETATRPSVDRLVGTIVTTVRTLRDNELFVRIVELDAELLLPYLLSRRGRSQDLVLALTEQQVRAGQATGEIRAGDPTAISRGLLLAVHGFVLSAHTMVGDGVSEAAIEAELSHLLTRGLVA